MFDQNVLQKLVASLPFDIQSISLTESYLPGAAKSSQRLGEPVGPARVNSSPGYRCLESFKSQEDGLADCLKLY